MCTMQGPVEAGGKECTVAFSSFVTRRVLTEISIDSHIEIHTLKRLIYG